MISIVNTECHVPKTFSDLAKIAAWGRLGHFREPVHAAQFGRLRALAGKNGMILQPTDAPFVSADELRIHTWLSQPKRIASFHPDAMLTLTIVHCAGTRDALGIRLPPTLFLAVEPDGLE